jgi:cytochrome c oxidase subunit 3
VIRNPVSDVIDNLPGQEEEPLARTSESPERIAAVRPAMSMGRLGLYIFLASYAIVFATLVAVVMILRSNSLDWPPPGVPHLSLPVGLLVTFILLASSIVLVLAERAEQRGNHRLFVRGTYLTIMLGLLFLVGQVMQFVTSGMTIQSGIYGGVYFTLAGFHAAHIVLGLFLLTRMLDWAHPRRAVPVNGNRETPTAVVVWHFLGVMWLPLFVVLYLL